MGTKTKICTKCGKRKPLSAFDKDCSKNDGVKSQCKDCMNSAAREARALLKEKQSKKKRLKESEESFKKALNEEVANRKTTMVEKAVKVKVDNKGKALDSNQVKMYEDTTQWLGKVIFDVVNAVAAAFGLSVEGVIKLKKK